MSGVGEDPLQCNLWNILAVTTISTYCYSPKERLTETITSLVNDRHTLVEWRACILVGMALVVKLILSTKRSNSPSTQQVPAHSKDPKSVFPLTSPSVKSGLKRIITNFKDTEVIRYILNVDFSLQDVYKDSNQRQSCTNILAIHIKYI